MKKRIKFQSTVWKCITCEKISITAKGECLYCECGTHDLPRPIYKKVDTQIELDIENPIVELLHTEYPKE